jgi:hypothetical protein
MRSSAQVLVNVLFVIDRALFHARLILKSGKGNLSAKQTSFEISHLRNEVSTWLDINA